MTLQKIIM